MSLRFIQGINRVIEGQAQEFLLKDEPSPTVSRYLQVAEGKTAALIATALTLAVESLGMGQEICQQVETAGMNLGILFQMQDDLLDIYGDKARDRRATDIAEGKISILIAQLYEDASATERERILAILRKSRELTTDGEISEVLELFSKYDTPGAVLRRISDLRQGVQELPLRRERPELHRMLMDMADLFLDPIRGRIPEQANGQRTQGRGR
jgi:geranylgeranyl pyrophosphate synthase